MLIAVGTDMLETIFSYAKLPHLSKTEVDKVHNKVSLDPWMQWIDIHKGLQKCEEKGAHLAITNSNWWYILQILWESSEIGGRSLYNVE